jgi:hypothetical protein
MKLIQTKSLSGKTRAVIFHKSRVVKKAGHDPHSALSLQPALNSTFQVCYGPRLCKKQGFANAAVQNKEIKGGALQDVVVVVFDSRVKAAIRSCFATWRPIMAGSVCSEFLHLSAQPAILQESISTESVRNQHSVALS